MTGPVAGTGYFGRLATSLGQLVRAPSHSRRAIARQRLAWHWTLLVAGCGVAIIALMLAVDVPTISLMPPRGTPSLWPVRILTGFGDADHILWIVGVLLVIIALVAPMLRGTSRLSLVALEIRVAFIFLAIAVPNIAGEILKGVIGRGRPFVGGAANAFNYQPFTWQGAFASLPSGHALTACSLAFAVAAVWPRTRYVMAVYAILILLSRLVLLAHHPSDVVAGALVGIIGAMFVRQWFAARRLGFAIHDDGRIVSLPGPSWATLKGVAAGPRAS